MTSYSGCFTHKETDKTFYYSEHQGEFDTIPDATHLVEVLAGVGVFYPYRAAKVLRTVAYIAVDEDEYGNVVWEKWPIKKHRQFK